ncbi:MAG: DsbA family protein [Gemmatimonadota bacterium]
MPLFLALSFGIARAQSAIPDAPARGAADPILTIVEFGDFECPSCALAAPVVDSLIDLYGDQARLEYRHYPLPMHEHATRAAQAAVEAERQGAFWSYHDLLFRNGERLTDADLVGYADSLGLDAGAFADALADGRHAGRVEADRLLGTSLAVTGTPTFFVNGYRIVGTPPIWVFELALEAFREGRVESRSLEPPRPPGEVGRDHR